MCRAGVSTAPTKGEGKKPYAPKCNGYFRHIWERAQAAVIDGSEEDGSDGE